MRLAVIVLLVLAGTARADMEYVDVAAVDDGTAWVLVKRNATLELRKVARDGSHVLEAPPTTAEITTIAVSPFDRSLWLLTDGKVFVRETGGGWVEIALPDHVSRYIDSVAVVPTAKGRGQVFGPAWSNNDEGARVFEIDVAAKTAVGSRFPVGFDRMIADGSGGVWAITRRGQNSRPETGYAHGGDTRWDHWFGSEQHAIEGMVSRGKARVPERFVALGSGLAAADSHELWIVDAEGRAGTRTRIPRDRFPIADQSRALVAHSGELWLVMGHGGSGTQEASDETSPVIRKFSRAGVHVGDERVPTPEWWRREHRTFTLPLRVSAAGDGIWILARDAVFFHTDDWRTLAAEGAVAGADSPVRVYISAPITGGWAYRDDRSGLALGFRPELVIAPNSSRPRFGFGAFVEVQGGGDESLVGGGLTLVRYGRGIGAALSVGVDSRSIGGERAPQLVISGFLGHRADWDLGPIDLPLGVRLDVRPGTRDLPASVMVAASVDAIAVGLAFYAIGKLAGMER